uniref:Uncharacterized protein n=1 Tax=Rhizophora mucronata TaxID=61149 RepID=A0A2P2K5E6_RHIMU
MFFGSLRCCEMKALEFKMVFSELSGAWCLFICLLFYH